MMPIELDARLAMLAALTPACEMAADIGADHGFLGVHLLESGKCRRVQLVDISEPSLRKARRLAERRGLADRALFSVGDGLAALVEPAQAIVVAGMGGPTIAGIVERGRSRIGGARLIIQPNVGDELLRSRLSALGLRIVDESLARAGGRWYVGIAAEEGCWPAPNDDELLAGPVLLAGPHPLLAGYAGFRMRVLEKALAGARQGDSARADELAGQLARWRRIAARLPAGRGGGGA
ncbi:MAG: SAM-dependent methyltransferase [Clostridiales bacterium]|nr:SAM-dependent methyltransferase [Clostridiales bacterium]